MQQSEEGTPIPIRSSRRGRNSQNPAYHRLESETHALPASFISLTLGKRIYE